MRSREGKLEEYFKDRIRDIKGISFKWTPKGINGVPDQIVMYLGKIWLVEIKNKDGTLRPSQKSTLPKIAEHHDVYVIYGHEEADKFIKEELVGWLLKRLEMICSAPSAPGKECSFLDIKQRVEEVGTDASIRRAVLELQQHFTPNLKFYPDSKKSQLKRKNGS